MAEPMNIEEARLSEQEIARVQMDWIKEFNKNTSQILTFPLKGELRDAVLTNAQLLKATPLIEKRAREKVADWLYAEFDCSQFRGQAGISNSQMKAIAFNVVEKIVEALKG